MPIADRVDLFSMKTNAHELQKHKLQKNNHVWGRWVKNNDQYKDVKSFHIVFERKYFVLISSFVAYILPVSLTDHHY